jgi:predicted unusual protein kinase regulating ubiquinone biosynthesis (AarF/ABC1/UbiB family)
MSAGGIAAVVAALAALVIIAVFWLGRVRFSGGRVTRLLQLGHLFARLSTSWLGALIRRSFAGRDGRRRIDAAQRAANAARVAETMGHMKGAMMKVGQMLSFVADSVPEEYRAALASLQAAAPAMEFAVIRDVAEAELGRPLERAFAQFDQEPLAAASIGQVHRARLPSGDRVVVKVQYPGVAQAIASDLANAGALYRMIGLVYRNVDPVALVAELRARVTEELDYRREADNQALFATLYADHPFIHVPGVVASHSTERVLTSEEVIGRRFAELLASDAETRSRVGEILYRFAFGSIFRFGIFNGDPHPGNYLYEASGKVAFLDYGSVKYFPVDVLQHWHALMASHLAGDRAAFRDNLIALGFLDPSSPVDTERVYQWLGYFYEPFHDDREFTFTREYNARSMKIVFAPEGNLKGLERELKLPADFVFVNRIQWGIYSLLGQLGARANWYRIQRELLFGDPPASELGVADAAHWSRFRAAHGLTGHRWLLGEGGDLSVERLRGSGAGAVGAAQARQ